MTVLLYGVLILVGFVLGYFFQTLVLVLLTIICLVASAYMAMTYREMEALITMIFVRCAIVVNIAMWVTHYIVTANLTNPSWLQNFIKTYILR
ncbi:MAG: hypothetical protein HYT62_02050 [Candidatus Yanofskybacteria bacterium]|nr:hypothetical protein [Candidatus Yanofskybacteria bacterium]